MPELDALTIGAATVAAFVLSGAYYAVLGDRLAAVSEAAAAVADQSPTPPQVVAELLRSLVVATVVAGLAAETATATAAGGLWLGLALWIGFPVVLWVGAILHERTPVALAAIHAGDWLAKLLAVGALVGVLR